MIFKRCGCKVPLLDELGHPVRDAAGRTKRRELGTSCPQLRRAGGRWNDRHGSWWFLLQLPGPTRRHLRQGGHSTRDEAEAVVDRIEQLLALAQDPDAPPGTLADLIEHLRYCLRARSPLPDPALLGKRLALGQPVEGAITVEQWLTEWLTTKTALRPTTLRSYESQVRLYLIPHLGHLRLDRLRAAHIHAMFAAIEAANEGTLANNALRKDLALQLGIASRTGYRELARGLRLQLAALPSHRRTVGSSSQHSIRATLRSALSDAAAQQLVTLNIAKLVKLGPRQRPKAKVWTEERVQRWRKTGEVPSAVMVWTPTQTNALLTRARHHPLHGMFRLIAHTGLRRGEACGLHWADLDLPAGTMAITEQIVQLGWDTHTDRPKSDAGERVIALGAAMKALLRSARHAQKTQRLAKGDGWADTGYVFTDNDGQPWHPAHVTAEFGRLIREAELPPIRLHDLRHGTATQALAAGVDHKVVQDILGHSSSAITLDTYTSVVDELKHAAAEAISDIFDNADREERRTEGKKREEREERDDDPDGGDTVMT